MGSGQPDVPAGDAGKAEKRMPHSIRFLDAEWQRIEAAAEERGLTGPEFVRFAALAAVEDGAGSGDGAARLAPLIERTFRATHMLVTRMRDEMLDAGRGEELEALIRGARGLQEDLLGEAPE